jgi:hypothetical protein
MKEIIPVTSCILMFFAGIISGFGIFYAGGNKTVSGVTSKTISGEPLTVKKTTVNNSGATIQTDYAGAGSSEIFIPAETIPQAADWMNKTIGISCGYSPRGALYPQAAYRFGSFNIFAGGRIPLKDMSARNQFDAYAGAGVWW